MIEAGLDAHTARLEDEGRPLRPRRSNRAKTHLGYTLTRTGRASWEWTTPHGLRRRVDPTGTHAPT